MEMKMEFVRLAQVNAMEVRKAREFAMEIAKEIEERNARAIKYSRAVALRRQRKADKVEQIKFYIGSFIGAASIFVMMFLVYLVGAMFV